MIIFFPALVALIGLLMYALCANPKLSEIGRIMFFCGLLAFLLLYPSHPLAIEGGGGGVIIERR